MIRSDKTTWTFVHVRPGVIAISGTPVQLRREMVTLESGRTISMYITYIYDMPEMHAYSFGLGKLDAKRAANTCVEMGFCDDQAEAT